MRIERRVDLRWWHTALASVFAIVVSLFLVGFAFVQVGADPLEVYAEIVRYAFLSEFGLPQTINRATFVSLAAFALIVPLRAGLWNIGMPGQIYAATLAAFGVAYAFGAKTAVDRPLPGGLVIPLMFLAALGAGAAYGAIAGFLRGRLQVNEIVTTMMLNWAMLWVVAHMIREGGPFMGRTAEGEGFTLPASIRIPQVLGLPVTVYLAVVLAVILAWFLTKTTLGYRIRTYGESPRAAEYAGIDATRVSTLVFALGGMLAGLAGYHYFAGVPGVYKIPKNYADFGDFSFYGLITGLIARNNPIAAIPVALLFGGVSGGARFMQGKLRFAFGIDYALLGVLMIMMVAFQALAHYTVRVERLAAVPAPQLELERGESRVESPRH
ncbi:MAG: ABC transporter permease [Dehalococcoidia bacterium]|nr:ABC transporter permease [Dehalococcoidia bacterium]